MSLLGREKKMKYKKKTQTGAALNELLGAEQQPQERSRQKTMFNKTTNFPQLNKMGMLLHAKEDRS